MWLILVTLGLIIAFLLFVQKIIYKRRLERGLGRKIDDRELTSINSWMQASTNKEDTEGRS